MQNAHYSCSRLYCREEVKHLGKQLSKSEIWLLQIVLETQSNHMFFQNSLYLSHFFFIGLSQERGWCLPCIPGDMLWGAW